MRRRPDWTGDSTPPEKDTRKNPVNYVLLEEKLCPNSVPNYVPTLYQTMYQLCTSVVVGVVKVAQLHGCTAT